MEDTGGAWTGRGSTTDAVEQSEELRYPFCVSVVAVVVAVGTMVEGMGVEGAELSSLDDSDVKEGGDGDLGFEQREASAAAATCSLSLCGLLLLLL